VTIKKGSKDWVDGHLARRSPSQPSAARGEGAQNEKVDFLRISFCVRSFLLGEHPDKVAVP
jgi:hypothetical protein